MATVLGREQARATASRAEAWGTMSWLVDDRSVPGIGLSVARMSVAPGATSPAHRHPNCHEVIHLIRGRIEQTAGDRLHRMAAGDTVVVAPGEVHKTRNLDPRSRPSS